MTVVTELPRGSSSGRGLVKPPCPVQCVHGSVTRLSASLERALRVTHQSGDGDPAFKPPMRYNRHSCFMA